jgi:hypothetical protein
MSAGDAARLLTLAALWGASFLFVFIRLAVLEVPPVGVVEARLALGALAIALSMLPPVSAQAGPASSDQRS